MAQIWDGPISHLLADADYRLLLANRYRLPIIGRLFYHVYCNPEMYFYTLYEYVILCIGLCTDRKVITCLSMSKEVGDDASYSKIISKFRFQIFFLTSILFSCISCHGVNINIPQYSILSADIYY